MRLWSLHPKYLDAKGLVALWREALLARHVLAGKTRGYKHHPQLLRFKNQPNDIASIDTFLSALYDEAIRRGYKFDKSKIGSARTRKGIPVTSKQMQYELGHLRKKLWMRDRKKFYRLTGIKKPEPHPLFTVVPGEIEEWEKTG